MILDFINDLKLYIKNSIILLDNNFSKLGVNDAYVNENTPTPPEIDIAIIDTPEDETSNSYEEGENVDQVFVNIYCYANAMRFDSKDEKTNAVISTTKLAEYLMQVLKKNVLLSNNSNVISSTRKSFTGAMQVEDSSMYVAILRYDFKIKNDYKKIYN